MACVSAPAWQLPDGWACAHALKIEQHFGVITRHETVTLADAWRRKDVCVQA